VTEPVSDSPVAPPRGPVIEVNLDEQTAQGMYSNLVITNYSQEEFLMDFLFLQPQSNKGKVRSRVIMTPANAKRLAASLDTLVRDYESKFGPLMKDNRLGPDVRFSIN
jgi:hypothetical protein